MDFRDLRYFCLTAELCHVTKAADQLGIAQPTLTRIISQIEEDIGGKLFEKDGRSIKLTPAGELFYKYSKKVINDVNALITKMDYVFDRSERTVRLLCNTESFATWLILQFKKAHPKYSISVLYAAKQEMIEALKNDEADFALCCPPIEKGGSSGICTELAFYEDGLILLPPNHPLLEKDSVTFDDLHNESLITMQKNSAMRNVLEPIWDSYSFHPHIICETNNQSMLIRAVLEGLGYAFVTKLIIKDYPELHKYCVEIDLSGKRGFFGLSYLKHSLQDQNNVHFKNFVLNSLKDLEIELYGENALEPLQVEEND